MTPTDQMYGAFEQAYRHFNSGLFGGELPPALLTFQRKGVRTMGYYSPQRFKERENENTTDEIALNPMHFQGTLEDTLSTLVHEMCHLWQQHCDKASRGGYHNKRWGAKMKLIGLHPSQTGKPGAKETGQQMHHYLIPGGPFEESCRKLLTGSFNVVWAEATASRKEPGPDAELPDADKGRVPWVCPGCRLKAWAKPSATLVCGKCAMDFVRRHSVVRSTLDSRRSSANPYDA